MDDIRRGYEVYGRELFELLRNDARCDVCLVKGSGVRYEDENVVFNVRRNSRLNKLLCLIFGADRQLYIEYLSFAVGLIPFLLFRTVDVYYVLDRPLYKFLFLWRRWCRKRFKLIHFTGGQFAAIPNTRFDYLHHVTPVHVKSATTAGFLPQNQYIIPHFVDTRQWSCAEMQDKATLRQLLGVPADSFVVLSVGSVDTSVKRMDYVVRECRTLSVPLFLLLIGQRGAESDAVFSAASRVLQPHTFTIRSVQRPQLSAYYCVADVFVLASLREGFGLVFLEALSAGLRIIAHDYDVTRFILAEHAMLTDLSVPGALTSALHAVATHVDTASDRARRQRYAHRRFDMQTLGREYTRMFLQVAADENTSHVKG